jgi:hypothetical protein
LVGCAAGVAAVAFSTFTVAAFLRVLDVIQEGFAPTWYRIGLGFQVGENLILILAFVLVGMGFLRASQRRERRMSLAAVAAAVAFLALLISHSIQAGVYNDTHHVPGTLIATYVVAAIGAAFLAAAAVTVALAYRRSKVAGSPRSGRDSGLALATLLLALGFALSMTSEILFFNAIHEREGLLLTIVGSGLAAVAASVATLAFLSSGRRHDQEVFASIRRRDALLAAALIIFAVAFAVQGFGLAIHADKSLAISLTDKEHAAYGLDGISFWGLSLGALCATAAFSLSYLAARPGQRNAPRSRAWIRRPRTRC